MDAPETAGREGSGAERSCASPLLLVTELFPPAVGGSAVLYENVYSRLSCPGVHVLTDPVTSATPEGPGDPFSIIHTTLRTRHWGLLDFSGTAHHWRVAGAIRRIGRERGAMVHCGRALPEGVAAWMSRLRGGPEYVCWAHGEDVATANTSRELTFVMGRVFSGAAGVLANSRNTARTLEELGVDGARIHVAYPGVD
ncbi:glycosyltransferase, partial [bacterium]|nr:glycosyltransferase [bacterium]